MNKDEKLELIVNHLNAAVPNGFECPFCHRRNFQVVKGFFQNIVQEDPLSFNLDGRSVPAVQIICQNCGFISHHSIGVLQPELIDNSHGAPDEESRKP